MNEKNEVKKGITDLTLKELRDQGINRFSDIGSKDGAALNLSFAKAIRLINYLKGKGTITWDSTFGEISNYIIEIFEVVFDLELKELDELKIQLSDMVSKEGITLNLTWDQLIKLINLNAGAGTITWKSSFKEASESIGSFL